jgi:hypothetical protein
MIVPKEKPILDKLNSYYIRIPKLIEHFQGEIGSGIVFIKSLTDEGSIVFDKDEILMGVFVSRGEMTVGEKAIEDFLNVDENASFSVSVYGINPDEIHFWSNLPNAKRIYQDLSTEFTDLEGLIKKMTHEELTGIIEVEIGDGNESGLLLMNGGSIIGGSYSWVDSQQPSNKGDIEALIQKTKTDGGIFHVSRLPSSKKDKVAVTSNPTASSIEGPAPRVVSAVEELLGIFERIIQSRKNSPGTFQTLLNRKFVDKADQFLFLDPFAGEFKYNNRKIYVVSDVTDQELWDGVMESVSELVSELGLVAVLQENLVSWKKKYQNESTLLGIPF